jgi:hypothetical protein
LRVRVFNKRFHGSFFAPVFSLPENSSHVSKQKNIIDFLTP